MPTKPFKFQVLLFSELFSVIEVVDLIIQDHTEYNYIVVPIQVDKNAR